MEKKDQKPYTGNEPQKEKLTESATTDSLKEYCRKKGIKLIEKKMKPGEVRVLVFPRPKDLKPKNK